MKKLIAFTAALSLVFITSCRSDNDNEAEQMNLVGNWRPDKIVSTATTGGIPTTTTVITDQCQQNGRIIFTNQGTGKIKFYDTQNETCSIVFDLDMTYTYNTGTKEFSVTTNGNKMDGSVTALTNDKMVAYYVDKSNPTTTNKIEVYATKVEN